MSLTDRAPGNGPLAERHTATSQSTLTDAPFASAQCLSRFSGVHALCRAAADLAVLPIHFLICLRPISNSSQPCGPSQRSGQLLPTWSQRSTFEPPSRFRRRQGRICPPAGPPLCQAQAASKFEGNTRSRPVGRLTSGCEVIDPSLASSFRIPGLSTRPSRPHAVDTGTVSGSLRRFKSW
jgi:hypothetical protein